MNYISAKEAANKWGVGERRVQYFCFNGKIPGAKRVGNQWIIPANSIRPADGRTKCAKDIQLIRPYRFPLYIFTTSYSSFEELDQIESELYKAQIYYLEGEHAKSMLICRKLEKIRCNIDVKVGVHTMIAYNSIVTGLYTEYKKALSTLEEIANIEDTHKEDYRLIIEAIKYNVTLKASPLMSINISRLSSEAVIYYQAMLLQASDFTSESESAISMKIYESICRYAEENGVSPLAMMLHFHLAGKYNKICDINSASKHIKSGCEIGTSKNWFAYISKLYYTNSMIFDKHLNSFDKSYPEKVKSFANRNISSWALIKSAEQGTPFLVNVSIMDAEYILNLWQGRSENEIASSRGLTLEDIKSKFDIIQSNLQLNSREELIEYADKLLDVNFAR